MNEKQQLKFTLRNAKSKFIRQNLTVNSRPKLLNIIIIHCYHISIFVQNFYNTQFLFLQVKITCDVARKLYKMFCNKIVEGVPKF